MDELTIKEAAEYIGKSTSWIRKKILNGKIQAEKESFKYGERYKISKQKLDDYQEIAKIKRKSVDVVEVEEKISKQDLMNELIEAINSQNKQVIQESMGKVTDKIDQQNKVIQEVLKENKEMRKELLKIKKRQNKSLWDKLKNIFK